MSYVLMELEIHESSNKTPEEIVDEVIDVLMRKSKLELSFKNSLIASIKEHSGPCSRIYCQLQINNSDEWIQNVGLGG